MPGKPENGKGGNIDTRKNPFNNRTPKKAISYSGVDNLASVLDAITNAGCAILLGRTRDGGAVVITVLDGDTRHRTFCSSEEELEDAFSALWNMYGEG